MQTASQTANNIIAILCVVGTDDETNCSCCRVAKTSLQPVIDVYRLCTATRAAGMDISAAASCAVQIARENMRKHTEGTLPHAMSCGSNTDPVRCLSCVSCHVVLCRVYLLGRQACCRPPSLPAHDCPT